VLVTVEDAGAVVAHPCATRISQTQEGTVEVYIPSVREAVLDRFHAVLDQWTATSAGLHVAEHTRTSGPGRPMRALPVGGVVSNRDNCGLMLLPTSTRSVVADQFVGAVAEGSFGGFAASAQRHDCSGARDLCAIAADQGDVTPDQHRPVLA